jgi:hypothetical protein
MLCNKEDLDILVEILNSSNNDNIKAGVRAEGYQRLFDFSRDSWKDLIRKLCSKVWEKEDRIPYIGIIEKKLSERIKKGSCKLSDVNEIMLNHSKKFVNGNVVNINIAIKEQNNDRKLLSLNELINL